MTWVSYIHSSESQGDLWMACGWKTDEYFLDMENQFICRDVLLREWYFGLLKTKQNKTLE